MANKKKPANKKMANKKRQKNQANKKITILVTGGGLETLETPQLWREGSVTRSLMGSGLKNK